MQADPVKQPDHLATLWQPSLLLHWVVLVGYRAVLNTYTAARCAATTNRIILIAADRALVG
jgi:hypothetical protein